MIGTVRSSHPGAWASAAGTTVTAAATDDTRTVLAIVALLVVVGVGLVMLTVWLFRVTRPDRELLAPLEVMGDRKWRRGEPVWQRRRLDEVRPDGAAPAKPAVAPPDIDHSYDAGPTAPGFEDLSDNEAVASPDLHGEADPAQADSPDVAVDDRDDSDRDDSDRDDSDRDDSDRDDSAQDMEPDDTDLDGAAGEADQSDDHHDDDVGQDVENRNIGDAEVDDAAEGGAALEPPGSNDDTTVDGMPSEAGAVSDDVSATPQHGLTLIDLAAAGPSARAEASLADLVAVTDDADGADPAVADDRDRPGR